MATDENETLSLVSDGDHICEVLSTTAKRKWSALASLPVSFGRLDARTTFVVLLLYSCDQRNETEA